MVEQKVNDYQLNEFPSQNQIALITGSSRGIGAAIAIRLAKQGIVPIIHAREKGPRAKKVAESVNRYVAPPKQISYFLADITNGEHVDTMYDKIRSNENLGHLDFLILNAAGGLEDGKDESYAQSINVDAQLNLVRKALDLGLISRGGKIIYITSHVAHLFKTGFQMASDDPDINQHLKRYQIIAETKHNCQLHLADMIHELERHGITLNFVSGPLVEDTIPVIYIEKKLEQLPKFKHAFGLITLEHMANAVVEIATYHPIKSGKTFIVGPDSFDRTIQTLKYIPGDAAEN